MESAEQNDEQEPMPIAVAVLDQGECRLGSAVDYDAALTLWATMSEDPSTWDEVAGYWARYRCPSVCEFVDSLPIRRCERDEALAAIEGQGNWIAIDLTHKRIVTGVDVQAVGRHATLALVTSESGKQSCLLPFNLPPWWELHEASSASTLSSARESEIQVPRTNRPFLFGSPMIEDLAKRIVGIASDGRLPDNSLGDREEAKALYALTVEVHRDWLMTQRDDLGGRRPRDLLHGAHDWSDAIIWGQQQRISEGAPSIACPEEVFGFADAPMGRDEMIIYFDLCRELIESGWFWLGKEIEANQGLEFSPSVREQGQLMEFLSGVRDSWLEQPFEGGAPPRFIIACGRRRVPIASGVPILGMEAEQIEQVEPHVPDCDCPICDMMASGLLGVGFTSLDGHHLDLDDEFAFSTHETIDAWEEQQREFADMSASIEQDTTEQDAEIADGKIDHEDFTSAWSSPMAEVMLPGDPLGHLKLSFRLAEIIGDLQVSEAPSEILKKLNIAFREYRQSSRDNRATAKANLATHLEDAAAEFPELLPKIADFQSQVDELHRS